MNEKIRLYFYGTSSQIVFVRFLGELKTPKRNFEINWPLETDQKNDEISRENAGAKYFSVFLLHLTSMYYIA